MGPISDVARLERYVCSTVAHGAFASCALATCASNATLAQII